MNENCLDCHSEIDYPLTWNSFIFPPEEQWLCHKCSLQLHPVIGERCLVCSRPLSLLQPEFINENKCLDCVRWEEAPDWTRILSKNTSLFLYNDYLKEYLARFKYRGDYLLAKAFSPVIKQVTRDLQYDIIIPIPLSLERLQERGFNQSEALANEAGFQTENLLTRTHSEKQSKKSRQERIHSKGIFEVHPEKASHIQSKTILIIDDIYTTGTTLRQAAKQLKYAGAKKVTSLTLARG
ncbi:ComF family protein [Bacillus sp. AK031]